MKDSCNFGRCKACQGEHQEPSRISRGRESFGVGGSVTGFAEEKFLVKCQAAYHLSANFVCLIYVAIL